MSNKPLNVYRLSSIATLKALAVEGAHGRQWYRDCEQALRALCYRRRWCPIHFAAVLAITSPRVQVPRNAKYTLDYMGVTTDDNGGDIYAHTAIKGLLPMVRAGLEHYERTGEIRGPKTEPFARAVLGEGDAIVLDTWMAKALGIPQARLKSKAVRLKANRRIQAVAKSLDWTPAQAQAAIWTAKFERAHVMSAPGLDTYLH